jgi:hypothetical protein
MMMMMMMMIWNISVATMYESFTTTWKINQPTKRRKEGERERGERGKKTGEDVVYNIN